MKGYLNHDNKVNVNSSMRVLRNAKITSVSLNVFKICTNEQCENKIEYTAGGKFADCVLCNAKMLKEDCLKKCEGRLNVKGYDENDLRRNMILSVTIDVLIKLFGEEWLSDEKKIESIGEQMLLFKNIDIHYNFSTMEVTTINKIEE